MPNELKHWGVLGMKWGVRRNRPDTSSPDHTISRELKKKKLNELSNDEIRKITTRLQLEKQYKDLTAAERAKGAKIVKAILSGPLAKAVINAALKRYVPGNYEDIFNNSTKRRRGNVVDSQFVD